MTLKPDVADQVEAVAQEARLDPDAVVDKAVRAYLVQWRRDKIRTEIAAFEQQRETLLAQYSGHYVALHEGQVVDHDPDLRTLHLRVFARLGHTPVLLKQVTSEPDREMVFRWIVSQEKPEGVLQSQR